MGLSIASGETVTIPAGERWLVGSTVENDGTLELAGTAMAGTAPAATGDIRVTGTVAEPSVVRIIPRRSDFSVDTDREDSFTLDGQ